jgi:NADPH-dependent 2,4-dienoyl-CoA reductase/sulfur reductase-like enzyme
MVAKKTEMRITVSAVLALGSALALGATLAQGQNSLVDGMGWRNSKPATVEYLYPGQVTVPAGKPRTVALHFRIAQGMHINSNTPKEKELTPTTFSIPASSGVRLDGTVYPPGAEFRPPLDPKAKLSVYTGEFTLRARIVAVAGNHLVEAKLHYQACANNECTPPKTITAAIDVIGQ